MKKTIVLSALAAFVAGCATPKYKKVVLEKDKQASEQEGLEPAYVPGVDVTDVTQVKGLEFDYVVLVEASAEHFPGDLASRRLLYVGATRAVHQLWITSVGTVTPLLAGMHGSEPTWETTFP